MFSNEKVAPLAQQLSWSHYSELLPVKDINKIIINANISLVNLYYRIGKILYDKSIW